MADQKVSAMTPISGFTGTELMPVVYAGNSVNYDATAAQMALYANGGGLTALEAAAGITTSQLNTCWPAYWAPRYGVDMTGNTDSTLSMNLAHSIGPPIIYPAGTVLFSNVVISKLPGGVVGASRYATVFNSTATANSAFLFNGTSGYYGPLLSGFQVNYTGTGYAIEVKSASSTYQIHGPRFLEVYTNVANNGIHLCAAPGARVAGCAMYGYTGFGLLVENPVDADSGDGTVIDTAFYGLTGSTQIMQYNGCMNRIIGCKVQSSGSGAGVVLNLNNVGSSSDLTIAHNSMEDLTQAVLIEQQVGATTTWGNIIVDANQMSEINQNYVYCNPTAGGFFGGIANGLTITNNVMSGPTGNSITAIYLDYINGQSLVSGNNIGGAWPYGTIATGIYIGPNCTAPITVGPNQIAGCTVRSVYPYFPAVAQVVPKDQQTGTTNITCSTSLGNGLYWGSATITFPTAFCWCSLQNGSVQITGALSGGGVSCYVYSASFTAIALVAVSTTNGGSVPVRWTMNGII